MKLITLLTVLSLAFGASSALAGEGCSKTNKDLLASTTATPQSQTVDQILKGDASY